MDITIRFSTALGPSFVGVDDDELVRETRMMLADVTMQFVNSHPEASLTDAPTVEIVLKRP
jgi:hypothetical protein